MVAEDIGVLGRIGHLIMVVDMETEHSSTMETLTSTGRTTFTITEIMSLPGMCSEEIEATLLPPGQRQDKGQALNPACQPMTETEPRVPELHRHPNNLQTGEQWLVQEHEMCIPTKPEMFTIGTATAIGVSAKAINGKAPSSHPK